MQFDWHLVYLSNVTESLLCPALTLPCNVSEDWVDVLWDVQVHVRGGHMSWHYGHTA